jgi:hypothetical protein
MTALVILIHPVETHSRKEVHCDAKNEYATGTPVEDVQVIVIIYVE